MPHNPIPRPLHLANEALAFLLELAALAGLCWWGLRVGPNLGAQLALGIGAPVALIVVWALFCAPKARVKLPRIPLMVLRTVLLLGAAAAVFATGSQATGSQVTGSQTTGWQVAAIVFAVVILLNALITVLDRDALINQPQRNAPRPTRVDAAARDIHDD